MDNSPPFELHIAPPHSFFKGCASCVPFQFAHNGDEAIESIDIEVRCGLLGEPVRKELVHPAPTDKLTGNLDFHPTQVGTQSSLCVVNVQRFGLRETYESEGQLRVRDKPSAPGDVQVVINAVSEGGVSGKGMFGALDTEVNQGTVHIGELNVSGQETASVDELIDKVPSAGPERLAFRRVAEVYTERHGEAGLAYAGVQAGEFLMGSDETDPDRKRDEERHRCRIVGGFWIGKTPVTQQQFERVMRTNPASEFDSEGSRKLLPHETALDHPVQNVSWQDAAAFCSRLNELARQRGSLPQGFAYRLPTEAEWEYACRAGLDDVRYGPLSEIAHTAENKARYTERVMMGAPNPLGLYDTLGNIFEWCLDCYQDYPLNFAVDKPTAALAGAGARVIRGGSWHEPKKYARAAARAMAPPDTRSSRIGFRVVLARQLG